MTGGEPRSAAGCVDCHVRRSQPFDLTEVRSADHWIRRRIEPPSTAALNQTSIAAAKQQGFPGIETNSEGQTLVTDSQRARVGVIR